MKAQIIIFIIIFLSRQVNAQSYKITYEYTPKAYDDRKVKLIVTDSASYQYVDIRGYAPKKNETVFGKKIVHHSNFYFPSNKMLYSTMGMNKEHPYMFTMKLPDKKWISLSDTKTIEGYVCKGRLHIDETGDSTLVFYSDQISKFGSPWFDCNDIPGLILEITDQKRQFMLTASKIETGDYKILFPADMEIVSAEERNRRVLAAREHQY